MTLADDVAMRLQGSMRLHKAASAMRNPRTAAGTRPRRPRVEIRTEARALLQQAADLRVEAHEMDRRHASPAWEEEQGASPRGRDTHEELMAFYRGLGLIGG